MNGAMDGVRGESRHLWCPCFVAAAVVFACRGHAQCTQTWVQVATTGPAGREGTYLAYDATRARVVLFGGAGNGGVRFNDTWTWDGSAWTVQNVTPSAAARGWGGAAYDPETDRVVAFGGNAINNLTNYGDTHEWDGVAWTLRTTTGPSQRCCFGMTFDATHGHTLLFGGGHLGVMSRETWAWDGGGWARLATTGPSVRYSPGLADDWRRQRVVFFGGSANHSASLRFDDTWEWDGAAWVQRFPSVFPGARRLHAMAFDPVRRVVILFGGDSQTGAFLGDTWAWDGAAWTQMMLEGPAARRTPVMVYDEARGGLLLFGGNTTAVQGDTWFLASPLGFIREPKSLLICPVGTAVFTVVVASGGGGTPVMRWQREISPGTWADLVDGVLAGFGTVAGSAGTSLSVSAFAPMFGTVRIRCMITNFCGSVTCDPVVLKVCRADWDCSGAVNSGDVTAFLNAWFGDLAGGTGISEFDGQPGITSGDVTAFLNAWFSALAGNC